MTKMSFEPWDKIVEVQVLNREALHIRECEEVTRVSAVEGLW